MLTTTPTADLHAASSDESLSVSDLFRRPILAASDGSDTALAALRISACVARRYESRVRVVTVIDPLSYGAASHGADLGGAGGGAELLRTASSLREAEVLHQIHDAAGGEEWPLEVVMGAPPSRVTLAAQDHDANMVILGLRSHSALDRVLGAETALRIMRRSRVPVLAVVPSLVELPLRVVAAVDFSRSSLRAAHAAASLVADGGTLYLAYVRPTVPPLTEDTEGLGVIYSQGVAGAFARMSAELWLPPRVRVQTVFLEGPPAEELMRFAELTGADLISVGSHRRSVVDRLRLGSVTTDLVRSAERSLLVSPPAGKQA